MLPSVSRTTPEPMLPALSDELFWELAEPPLPVMAVMDTTEGSALADTASARVVSSASIFRVCVVPLDEPLSVATTLVSVMRKAPDITSAMTSTAPTARPARDARNTGSFLVLVFTTVCLTVSVTGADVLATYGICSVGAVPAADAAPRWASVCCVCSAGCGVGSTSTRGAGPAPSGRWGNFSSLITRSFLASEYGYVVPQRANAFPPFHMRLRQL